MLKRSEISSKTFNSIIDTLNNPREAAIICLKNKGFTIKQIANLKKANVDFENKTINKITVSAYTLEMVKSAMLQNVVIIANTVHNLPKSEYIFRNVLGNKLSINCIAQTVLEFNKQYNTNI